MRNRTSLPQLTLDHILSWADEYRRGTGTWPIVLSGPIAGSDGNTWSGVDTALRRGDRDPAGDSSLARLLADQRGVPNLHELPRLTIKRILSWARDHRGRTGTWPAVRSGPIAGSDSDTWHAVDSALRNGYRGLPGQDSLAQLLTRHRKGKG